MRRKTKILRALDRVMSPEHYAKRKHTTPYLYTLGSGDEALTFVGAHHSSDPEDQLFPVIDDAITEFKPDIIFVEGMQGFDGVAGTEQFIRGLDRADAITRGGESVYTIKRALELGIPWSCPEPSDTSIYSVLLDSYYSRSEIAAWHMLCILSQYQARSEALPFNAYIAPFLGQFKKATDWTNFDYSLEYAVTTAQQVLGQSFSIRNVDRASEYTDPIPWPHRWEVQTHFNEMTRIALHHRDQYIVRQIAKEVQAGKRVMVVYGAGHAVMQEPSYRYLLES